MLLFSPFFFFFFNWVFSWGSTCSPKVSTSGVLQPGVCEPGFTQHKASLSHGWLTSRDFQTSPRFQKEIRYSSRRALLWKLLETPSLLIEKHFFLHILAQQLSSGCVSLKHFLLVALVAARELAPLIYSQGSVLNTALNKSQKTPTISLR